MSEKKGSALVVLSGGQDSTTCLFWAKQRFARVEAVTFAYGQRHIREIDAAAAVVEMAGVDAWEVVDFGANVLAGTSPLTDPSQPLEQYENHDQMAAIIGDRVELTFVPMRNALFLTVAMNRAVVRGLDAVVTGVCQADNANYPDCRRGFIDAVEIMAAMALGKEDGPGMIPILTPLMDLSKDQSVLMATHLPGCYRALGYSHTAYDGSYPPTGHDHATVLRAWGFEKAGVPDPLIARAYFEGLLPELPQTANYAVIAEGRVAGFEELVSAVEHEAPGWEDPSAQAAA